MCADLLRPSEPRPMRLHHFTLLAAIVCPIAASAQQWKSLGKTKRDSTEVFVRSIKRGGDTVTATVLARFATPAIDGKDTLRAQTTVATFNCKVEKVAVKETTYYVNFDKKRVAEHRGVKKPGYGPVLGAVFDAAYKYLCPPLRSDP